MDRITRDSTFKKLVLVAEDETVNRLILGHMLETYGYDVLYAEDGVQTMRQIRAHQHILSMILLDLNMPEMSGYEVLRMLRGEKHLSRIPVIVLTSEIEAEVESLELGAVDFITKPYSDGRVIAARVRRNIELAEDKQIIQNAQRDSVTGLYTREFFFEYARQWDLYHQGQEMDCVVLNINRFHMINELHGHEEGDRLLRLMGSLLDERLELTGGIGCRSEADHFLLYMPHRTDHDEASGRLMEELNGKSPVPNVRIRVGLVAKEDGQADHRRYFDRASSACHSIRNDYTTMTACYDERMHEQAIYHERLVDDMDRAIRQEEFRVLFQPTQYNNPYSPPARERSPHCSLNRHQNQ